MRLSISIITIDSYEERVYFCRQTDRQVYVCEGVDRQVKVCVCVCRCLGMMMLSTR